MKTLDEIMNNVRRYAVECSIGTSFEDLYQLNGIIRHDIQALIDAQALQFKSVLEHARQDLIAQHGAALPVVPLIHNYITRSIDNAASIEHIDAALAMMPANKGEVKP